MKRVLVVSPCFPPSNAADMQRVRQSLPYFRDFGWDPHVLAVHPDDCEVVQDQLLLGSVPADVEVERVRAIPLKWTRRFGLGQLALRSIWSLYRSGAELLSRDKFDLVYISTTACPSQVLGRMWRRRFGVPFVLDIQDPWATDYHLQNPNQANRTWKFKVTNKINWTAEPWTMQDVGGLIAVSSAYIDTLRSRYPWLASRPALTLPFAASARDLDVAKSLPPTNRFFTPGDGLIHGVYVGRGGHDMAKTFRLAFAAFRRGLSLAPETFGRVRLHFVGTSYGQGANLPRFVDPVAREFGLESFVSEEPQRVPYFEGLRMLLDADFLFVPGSDDPQYTASKIYPYILVDRPMLAVFSRTSSVWDVLCATGAANPFPLDGDPNLFGDQWRDLLAALPEKPPTDFRALEPFLAREMTRKQCALFDEVIARA